MTRLSRTGVAVISIFAERWVHKSQQMSKNLVKHALTLLCCANHHTFDLLKLYKLSFWPPHSNFTSWPTRRLPLGSWTNPISLFQEALGVLIQWNEEQTKWSCLQEVQSPIVLTIILNVTDKVWTLPVLRSFEECSSCRVAYVFMGHCEVLILERIEEGALFIHMLQFSTVM